MKRERVNILGTQFDKVTRTEAVERIVGYLTSGTKASVFTPNPEIVIEAYRDPLFQQVLNESEMVIPDGIGIIIGSKIIRQPLPERVAGYDTLLDVFAAIEDTHLKVFFLGSAPGVAEAARRELKKKHPGLDIVGVHDGYFDSDQKVIDAINADAPDLLLVGLGAPKQEYWIQKNREKVNATVLYGCGGSLDGFSGKVQRSPEIFISLNLEWFHRLITQPSRWRRMLRLPLFIYRMILEGRKYEQE